MRIGDLVDNHPFASIKAYPQSDTSPETWMLGTSDYGAQVAAHFGVPYCFAHFITDGRGVGRAFDVYRDNYQPSPRFPKPIATICLWALAAETEKQARHSYASRAHNKVMRDYGELGPLLSPEDALAFSYNNVQQARFEQLTNEAIIGDAGQVATTLREIAAGYEIDEIAVLTWAHDPAVQKRSYELLAEEFKLNA